MKITRIETIWIDEQPNTLWVRLHTDDGLIGLGETYYTPRAVSAIIHDVFATLLLGRSPLDIENHWTNLFSTVNFFGYAGAETRAISAVDVALWDIVGQYTGQPIYNLLGGRNRERVPVYNTCVSHGAIQDFHRWRYENRTGELAAELLQQGIKAMKIWPFDQFGASLGGPIGQRAGAEAVGEHKTSMLQDVERGRAIELDALLGSVVELARITGVETPRIDAIYACASLLAVTLADRGGRLEIRQGD